MYQATYDQFSNRDQLQNQSKAIGHVGDITSANSNNEYQQLYDNQRKLDDIHQQTTQQQHIDHLQTLADIEAIINLEESKFQPLNQQVDEDYNYTTTNNNNNYTTDNPIPLAGSLTIANENNNTDTGRIKTAELATAQIKPTTPDNNSMATSEMQVDINSKSASPSKNLNARPYVKIIEQPARCSLRFRYECEGRSAGSLPGANSTPENKTYPTIQIMNYVGRAVVVVSCVTKDYPFRPHPHNLVGKEGCKKGICTIVMNNNPDMICSFTSLGIQCVKKKDIEGSLWVRETIQVDPFRTGFAHKQRISNIDLNVVRLCFQVFIEGPDHANCTVPLTPVVSEAIHDKKAMSDLVITKLSHCSAPATGGREVILLCDRISKDDIQIRFYEERNGKLLWEKYSEFQQNDVHKQVAICFRTPKYYNEDIQHPVMVRVQLRRPSDNQVSEPRLFQFLPCENDEDMVARKRQKIERIDLNSYVKENILGQHNQQQQQHQQQQQQLMQYPQQQHQQLNQSSNLQARSNICPQQQPHQNPQHQLQVTTNQGQSTSGHQATISPVTGVSEPQQIYMTAIHSNYQKQQITATTNTTTNTDNSRIISENNTPSSSPNPFAVPKLTHQTSTTTTNQAAHQQQQQQNYNYHLQKLQQQDSSSRQNTPSPSSSSAHHHHHHHHQQNHHHHHQQQQQQQQLVNHRLQQQTIATDNENSITSYGLQHIATYYNPGPLSQTTNKVTILNSPSCNVNNTSSPQYSPAPTPIAQLQQHSPNHHPHARNTEPQDNFIEISANHHHHQRPQQQHHNQYHNHLQAPMADRVVVKHEIIDDDGKIMQIVDRSPQQTTGDLQSDSRPQLALRNNTSDANALSTRLDSLGLDGLDTTLMKEIAFNSALMLNLDSNLSLHLPSNSNIVMGSANHSPNHDDGGLSANDNNGLTQPGHTLNTPQVSELDPQLVGSSSNITNNNSTIDLNEAR